MLVSSEGIVVIGRTSSIKIKMIATTAIGVIMTLIATAKIIAILIRPIVSSRTRRPVQGSDDTPVRRSLGGTRSFGCVHTDCSEDNSGSRF